MLSPTSRYAELSARWAAIALGFSIPITVALNNALLAIMLIAWLLGGGLREKLAAFRHPAAIAPIALFAVVSFGTLYGDANLGSALVHVRKYADLLLVPIFLHLFRDARIRRQAIYAFAISMTAILALSYLLKLGVRLDIPSIQGDQGYPVVFKQHLTHNILVAFAVFVFVRLALDAASRWKQTGWTTLAVLAAANVTVMVHGATGYLVLAALLLLLGHGKLGWHGVAAAVLGIAVCAAALMMVPNPFKERVNKIATELQAWRVDQPAQTSTGWRLEFYDNSLAVIADHPLIGVGTGGFASAYAEKVRGTGKVATHNPHNEFLLMWAQLGIIGILAFVWMYWRQWQLAAKLPTRLESELARALIVTMVIGCMLNSLLLDHTEGLFYAWLTGVLYGGLNSVGSEKAAQNDARTVTEAIR